MRALGLAAPGERLSVLCLGAHSDDIEIGAAGLLLSLLAEGVALDVTWCVLSARGPRREEALAGAAAVLSGASETRIEVCDFRDGHFPAESTRIKEWMEDLKAGIAPQLVLTHRGDDAHQDHREVSRLTWNTFRDHLVLEYEIPKWDGDLGQPNVYVPLTASVLGAKITLLEAAFGSQRSKDWFDAETFRGLARLRGMECRAPERYAEGFYARKLRLGH